MAKAYFNMDMNKNAITILTQACSAEPNNDLVNDLMSKIKEEERLDSLMENNPDAQKFIAFNSWLLEHGVNMDKLKLVWHSKENRVVHAKRDILKGELILEIPTKLLITGDGLNGQIDICEKMMKHPTFGIEKNRTHKLFVIN